MKTQLVKLDNTSQDAEKLDLAAKIVTNGHVVAFPTETVYGLACLARREPIDRLNKIKNRPPEKHYTLHIADKSSLSKYLPHIEPSARKLISNAWPGPLTIVFALDDQNLTHLKQTLHPEEFEILCEQRSIGVRCPDNPIARSLLSKVDSPVIAPSANISGHPPAATSAQVLDQLDGKIDMVLDATKWANPQLDQSSTVVSLGRVKRQILRQGAYPASEVEKNSTVNILFVCTGNTCRSPMAEAFCKKQLAEKLKCKIDELPLYGYKVSSAGVMGFEGAPASHEVIDICHSSGIDMTQHRSSALDADLIDQSDYIFALTDSHRQRMLQVRPDAQHKCHLLDSQGDIADPIGCGMKVYAHCAEQIGRALEVRINEIWYENSSSK